ncbi:MAG: hypothetical protein WCT77_01265 [Bacteroidota bacterium]
MKLATSTINKVKQNYFLVVRPESKEKDNEEAKHFYVSQPRYVKKVLKNLLDEIRNEELIDPDMHADIIFLFEEYFASLGNLNNYNEVKVDSLCEDFEPDDDYSDN